MVNNHPLNPSTELVHEWHRKACRDPYNTGTFVESKTLMSIATDAVQWGADQELEACIQWLKLNIHEYAADKLYEARRPKPLRRKKI